MARKKKVGDESEEKQANRYVQIIEKIFHDHYTEGATEVLFHRDDLEEAVKTLDIDRPKNLGDIVYSFRYRNSLPQSVIERVPSGKSWVIWPNGRAKYKFLAVEVSTISPTALIAETKIPDSTPGLITKYALSDEQALLAKIRYNHLIDIFTGITCFSLQNHLRTQVGDMGQVETDELYIGIDDRGAHYVMPVQAKGGRDVISVVQIGQDFALSAEKFPDLICRPIAAHFTPPDLIVMFSFRATLNGVERLSEKRYRLVPPSEVSKEDLEEYRQRQREVSQT